MSAALGTRTDGKDAQNDVDGAAAFTVEVPTGRWRRRPVVYAAPFAMERHVKGYDTWLFTDMFLKDDSIVITTMLYVDTGRNLEKGLEVRSPLFKAEGGSMRFTEWHVREGYESVIVGILKHPALAGVDRLPVEVVYTPEPWENTPSQQRQNHTLLRAPGGWESRFAMCTLFLQDRHLLRMWTGYWHAMGVDAFYFYYNGSPEDIFAMEVLLAELPANVTFIHWPFDYWVKDVDRPHHGQPMAVNDCYRRNRDRHDIMLFYDLDEIAVFKEHTTLAGFYDSLPRPWTAMRTQSAWARIDLKALNVSYDALEVTHIAAAPLERAPVHYSREKYAVNTTSGVPLVNVHGVYMIDTAPRPAVPGTADARGWPQLLLNESVGYHFHFTNVGRDRTRGTYLADPVIDHRAMETARANLDALGGWPPKRRRGEPPRDAQSAAASAGSTQHSADKRKGSGA